MGLLLRGVRVRVWVRVRVRVRGRKDLTGLGALLCVRTGLLYGCDGATLAWEFK